MTPALDLGKWLVRDRNFLNGADGSIRDICVKRLDVFHCMAHSLRTSSLFFCLAVNIPIGNFLRKHGGKRFEGLVAVASNAALFAAWSVASLPSISL